MKMAWMLSLKVVLISSGVVALALAMKLSVPLAMEFITSQVPLIWSSLRSLLRPPYLYVVINAIIITIAASSRFHGHHDQPQAKEVPTTTPPPVVVYEQREEEEEPVSVAVVQELRSAMVLKASAIAEPEVEDRDDEDDELVISRSTWTPPKRSLNSSVEIALPAEKPLVSERFSHRKPAKSSPEDRDDEEDELVISRSTWTPPKRSLNSSVEIALPAEKPLVSARFSHRKPAKSSPEAARPLRVQFSKPKRHETMENTWKAITEGRSMPLSRHMKKSETLLNHGRNAEVLAELDPLAVLKAETFTDRTNFQQLTVAAVTGSGAKLRKEPSLGQDDLNRRVEAFISKFNQEMRLQREESLNQYKEMINRGSQY